MLSKLLRDYLARVLLRKHETAETGRVPAQMQA